MTVFKLAGSILVLVSAALTGFYMAGLSEKRLKSLEELKRALTILKGEISFALTPFGEACLIVSERVLPPIDEIFKEAGTIALSKNLKDAGDIWEAALNCTDSCGFTKEDSSAIESMGKNLGYLDKDMQIKTIDLLLAYIDSTANKINGNKDKEARMYKSLGILGGLLIVVIML